ncbi:PDZ domain-containing protein [Frankia sp. B2]|uniref:YlbL family protein n=1 Tax=unclassified Frankia TaxID=2632575 RepID=UPI0003CFAA5B|nr:MULTISPECIES: PDZ domain-containing protein [unclassified Frankia]ETA01297.1 putative secreted protein [Frankia sp. CcI6]KDA42041.1 putative secreted protein containing a PDZ domain [Frankia sp. BMG5.23]OHV53015.1 signal protein PDZ [Frankia sp. CgIS1]ORT53095.1 signal protein PDZ [Frankia sp. KB5]TFE28418.1 PDZ domain-containing protein [Frankia sp. B2]
MVRRTQTLVVASVLALVLVVAGLWMPVPFVTLAPGPVTDTLGSVDGTSLITVDGRRTYPTAGKLELTTVEETPRLNLVTALRDWSDSDRAVVPSELIRPPGSSQEQIQQENAQAMLDSQDQATAAALAQLGIAPTGRSVAVAGVPTGSPATGKLMPGDVIVQVGGMAVANQEELRRQIGKVAPGHPVTVTYRRDGKTATATVTTRAATDDPARAMIGVTTTEKRTYPFTVRIRISDVGGPSAGLMFAMGIVDLLTPGALTGGKIIAGTGTITSAGEVGPIGGIQQKILGARASGASIFLVPAGNCGDARAIDSGGPRLVKVESLAGALKAVDALRTNPAAAVPSC